MTPWRGSGNEATALIEPVRLDGFDGGHRFGVWWLPVDREPRGPSCAQPLGEEHARHATRWLRRRGGYRRAAGRS